MVLVFTVNFSEKALVERSFELRAELENAASDVSNLFAKIGSYYHFGNSTCFWVFSTQIRGDLLLIMVDFSERKDKIEDGNRILIQKFQSQLTQQLEILHKTVAASVTQQEQQLKDMEEDMQSFVSTKVEVQSKLDDCVCSSGLMSIHLIFSFVILEGY